jgi:WD40 repeat protein
VKSIFFVLLLVFFSVNTEAAEKNLLQFQSYQAHIGAANHAILLHETSDAMHWLQQAPVSLRAWEWHYLNKRIAQAESGLGSMTSEVQQISISPNGSWLASIDKNKTIRLRDLANAKEIWTFLDETLLPQSLSFHPQSSLLAVAFSKHTVKIFNTIIGKEQLNLQGKGRGITAIAFSPNGNEIASASWNFSKERGVWGIVEIWDSQTGALLKQLEYGEKPLVSIAYSPDGQFLAVGSWEVQKTVALWNTANWGPVELYDSEEDGQYKAVQSIQFSPDSKLLAAGGKDGKVRVWDVKTKQRAATFGGLGWGHTKWVNSIQFSPNGQFLLSASTDQTIRIWNIAKREQTAVLLAHTNRVNSLAIAPNGKFFLSAGAPEIKRWNSSIIHESSITPDRLTHAGSVYGIDFSDDGKHIYTAAWKGGISMWDAHTQEKIMEWPAHQASANAVSVSKDQARIASVGNDGYIKIWQRDLNSNQYLTFASFDEVKGNQLIAVNLSANGKQVFAASSEGYAQVWDIAEKRVVLKLNHASKIAATAMSQDEKYYATGGQDGSILIWDAKTGKQIKAYKHHKSQINRLSFHPKSTYLVASSSDRSLSKINLKDYTHVQLADAHAETIHSVAYSPDGKRLVSASSDQTVKIWDADRLQVLLKLPYDNPVYSAEFSPDGKTLYTLPMDGTVRILSIAK